MSKGTAGQKEVQGLSDRLYRHRRGADRRGQAASLRWHRSDVQVLHEKVGKMAVAQFLTGPDRGHALCHPYHSDRLRPKSGRKWGRQSKSLCSPACSRRVTLVKLGDRTKRLPPMREKVSSIANTGYAQWRPSPSSTRASDPGGRPEHYLQGHRSDALTALADRGPSTWHPPFDEGPVV